MCPLKILHFATVPNKLTVKPGLAFYEPEFPPNLGLEVNGNLK